MTSPDNTYHILKVLVDFDIVRRLDGGGGNQRYCTFGQPSAWVERALSLITRLPRPLLDLIAHVSLKEVVSRELRPLLMTLPNTPLKPESVWRCFAVTALLRVESHMGPCATSELALELLVLLRLLISTSVGEGSCSCPWLAGI